MRRKLQWMERFFSGATPHAWEDSGGRGLLRGVAKDTEQQDREGTITRAEVVTLIVGQLDLPLPDDTSLPFHDVPEDIWYAEAVRAAVEAGFLQGYPDGMFRGEEPITVIAALKLATVAPGFADPQEEEESARWFDPYLRAAGKAGLLEGLSLPPLGAPAQRGWVMQVLANAAR